MTRARSVTLVMLLALAAACGDNSLTRSLAFTEPAVGSSPLSLCVDDDRSAILEGMQINVRIAAPGFDDGEEVTLAFDSPAPNPNVKEAALDQVVNFASVTVPGGVHAVRAISADGDVTSRDILLVSVDTAPPEMEFLAPEMDDQLGIA